MSKIGKKNILIPKDSSIKIEGSNLTITGPKGSTKLNINDKIFSPGNNCYKGTTLKFFSINFFAISGTNVAGPPISGGKIPTTISIFINLFFEICFVSNYFFNHFF